MQLLNSILLEGSLIDIPAFAPAPSGDTFDTCCFNLDCGPTAPSIPVIAQSRLALRCHELLDRGSAVRIVGRIIHDKESSERTGTFSLAIMVEHVEVRPAYRRAEVA